jgi:hypothetical protein
MQIQTTIIHNSRNPQTATFVIWQSEQDWTPELEAEVAQALREGLPMRNIDVLLRGRESLEEIEYLSRKMPEYLQPGFIEEKLQELMATADKQ